MIDGLNHLFIIPYCTSAHMYTQDQSSHYFLLADRHVFGPSQSLWSMKGSDPYVVPKGQIGVSRLEWQSTAD